MIKVQMNARTIYDMQQQIKAGEAIDSFVLRNAIEEIPSRPAPRSMAQLRNSEKLDNTKRVEGAQETQALQSKKPMSQVDASDALNAIITHPLFQPKTVDLQLFEGPADGKDTAQNIIAKLLSNLPRSVTTLSVGTLYEQSEVELLKTVLREHDNICTLVVNARQYFLDNITTNGAARLVEIVSSLPKHCSLFLCKTGVHVPYFDTNKTLTDNRFNGFVIKDNIVGTFKDGQQVEECAWSSDVGTRTGGTMVTQDGVTKVYENGQEVLSAVAFPVGSKMPLDGHESFAKLTTPSATDVREVVGALQDIIDVQ